MSGEEEKKIGKKLIGFLLVSILLIGGISCFARIRDQNAEILKSVYYSETEEIISEVLADLTHDGRDDLVLICKNTMDEYHLKVYSVINKKPVLTYEDTISDNHAGWRWYYIYTSNNKKYLMQYIPEIWNGFGEYRLEIFFIDTKSNRKDMIVSNAVAYDSVHNPDSEMEKKLLQFKKELEDYQSDSVPLITIGYDSLTHKNYEYIIETEGLEWNGKGAI